MLNHLELPKRTDIIVL